MARAGGDHDQDLGVLASWRLQRLDQHLFAPQTWGFQPETL
jgi:hypothetical protein